MHAHLKEPGGTLASGAVGSGFFIRSNGLICTSNHLIQGTDEVVIQYQDSQGKPRIVDASVVAQDISSDLAVLKIDATTSTLEIAQSDPRLGDRCILAGYPLGFPLATVMTGIVASRPHEFQVASTRVTGFALDVSINNGHSGGPVCDDKGTVIGLAAAKRENLAKLTVARLRPIKDENIRTTLTRALAGVGESTSSGLGMAVPPRSIRHLMEAAERLLRRDTHVAEEVPKVVVDTGSLWALQEWCNRHGYSPVGPFSFNRDLDLWPSSGGKKALVDHSLSDFIERMLILRPNGGQFYFLGKHVCTYDSVRSSFVMQMKVELV